MKKLLLVYFLSTFLFLLKTTAQVVLPTTGSRTEDFDAIGATATASIPTGWKISPPGETAPTYGAAGNFTATLQQASSGAPTAGSRYNWGTSSAERSLGFMTSSSYASPSSIMVAYSNTTGSTLNKLDVSFAIERYRVNTRVASVEFYYSLDGSTWVAVSSGNVSNAELPTETTSSYTFATPLTVNKSISISSLNIANNGVIYLRWNFNNGGTNSQGIGLDNVVVTPTYSSSSSPTLTASPTDIAFGNQNINTTSTERTFVLSAANLTSAAVTLNTSAPYSISKTSGTGFSTSLTYANTDLGTDQTVYVRYSPTATGAAAGSIAIIGGGTSSTTTVNLTGSGIDPNVTSFDFESCTPSGSTTLAHGFTQYSVTGAQTWACTTFGNVSGNAVQINGYSGGNNVNEDWLISPSLNLSSMNFPILSFWSRSAFTGASLKLKYSTNYSGTGNPNLATWTEIEGKFPVVSSDVWTKSDNIDLTALKSQPLYIAFVYTSSSTDGSRWTLDDVAITNSSTAAPVELGLPSTQLNFGFQANGSTSAERTFTFSASNLTNDVTLTAPANFTISKTSGGIFGSSLTYNVASINNTAQTVYAKFTPSANNQNYSQTLNISTTGTATKNLTLVGNSFDKANTLEVVNWNIEWFGSPAQNPSNDALQATNVRTIVNAMNADIYGFAEVVDTTLFRNEVLPPGYNVIFSEFGSYADDKSDTDYPLAQKLAFMYRTDIIKPLSLFGVLRDTYNPSVSTTYADGTPYKNWSSGRFPFLMRANVTLNGTTEEVYFIEIHAKANTGTTDAEKIDAYNRRKGGSLQLKNWIDANLAGKKVMIIGDFNDVLDPDKTIAPSGAPQKTSYSDFTESTAYVPITLPLSLAGKRSTAGFPTVIDNVIINNELNANYVGNSAEVLDNLASLVTNYSSTTTDHYAIQARYLFEKPLPIKLSSFDAKANRDVAEIKWTTATETNNDFFTVERSTDGKKFITVKTVKGAGNSEQLINYSAIDANPINGVNYYRLKQTDFDGKYSYSEIKSVRFTSLKENLLSVYPNPVVSQITLALATESTSVQMLVSSTDGKTVLKETGSLGTLNQKLNNKLSQLATGVYIVQLTVNGQQYKAKFIKQ